MKQAENIDRATPPILGVVKVSYVMEDDLGHNYGVMFINDHFHMVDDQEHVFDQSVRMAKALNCAIHEAVLSSDRLMMKIAENDQVLDVLGNPRMYSEDFLRLMDEAGYTCQVYEPSVDDLDLPSERQFVDCVMSHDTVAAMLIHTKENIRDVLISAGCENTLQNRRVLTKAIIRLYEPTAENLMEEALSEVRHLLTRPRSNRLRAA